MRSRYAAYVLGAIDYLVETTHPKARRPGLREGYLSTHQQIQWLGLEVLATSHGNAQDKTGKVEFRASYLQAGEQAVHYGKSRFKRHSGRWHYLDGVVHDR